MGVLLFLHIAEWLELQMNENLVKQQLLRRAQVLGAVHGRHPNLKVTISGERAWQVEGHINIPAGDFTDPEFVTLCEGYIDHENGHQRHSDDEPYEIAGKFPPLNSLLQSIEDIRMEREQGRLYRGIKSNLNRMVNLMVKRNSFPASSYAIKQGANPFIAIRALVMYRGRWQELGNEPMESLSYDAYDTAVEVFGQSVTDEICAVIDRFSGLANTHESLLAAEKILEILKIKQDEPEDDEDDEDDSGQPEDDDSEGSGNAGADDDSEGSGNAGADDDPEGSGNAGADDDPESSGEPKSGNSDGSQPAGQCGFNDGKGTGRVLMEPTADEIAKAIEAAFDITNRELPRDYHEEIANLISYQAYDDQVLEHVAYASECSLDESMPKKTPHLLEKQVAKRLSGSIYQTLHKVLFDEVQNLEILRLRGTKIKSSKLAGISAGNFAVFKQRTEQADTSAAISVVVDSSESMMNDPSIMRAANTSALAFAMGAEKAGVSTHVMYYGLTGGGTYTAKRFGDKCRSDNFTVVGTGGTPTGQAMENALYALLSRPEQNKMMFVLTDGQPDCAERVATTASFLKLFGIKVVPIGIGQTHVNGFKQGEYVCIQDIAELPTVMKQAIKLGLFK